MVVTTFSDIYRVCYCCYPVKLSFAELCLAALPELAVGAGALLDGLLSGSPLYAE